MKKIILIIMAIFLIAILSNFVSAELTLAEEPLKEDYKILLKSRSFMPLKEEGEIGKIKHGIIQFYSIPDEEEKKELENLGIKLYDYIPRNAFLAKLPLGFDASKFSNVRAITSLLPEDKISEKIKNKEIGEWAISQDKIAVAVAFFEDVSLKEAEKILSTEIYEKSDLLNALVILANEKEIKKLALKDEVKFIAPISMPLTALNDNARASTEVDNVQSIYNLTGKNIRVLVYDTGAASHPDLTGRIFVGDGSAITDHSSHVAGTVAGNGNLSTFAGGTARQWRGVAPNATIISFGSSSCVPQCWYNSTTDVQTDTNSSIFTWNASFGTASLGANVVGNGYPCAWLGDYELNSILLDKIVRGSLGKRFAFTWAAGNERTSGAPCGNFNSVGNPGGTAKNLISVGAMNSNDRSQTTFTSFGPTDDLRIKPDISAPGCQSNGDGGIKSTVPNLFINIRTRNCAPGVPGPGPNTNGDDFCFPYDTMCGTSMATPHVAGIIALMLEQINKSNSAWFPWPSSLKAILIHTASYLSTNGNGSIVRNIGPHHRHGYGYVNATKAVELVRDDAGTNDFVIEDRVSSANLQDTYSFSVPPNTTEIKATLVWDDKEGSYLAAITLVNDLDLWLESPNGTIFRPWLINVSGANAVKGVNRRDNVEQVYVENPASGWWEAKVNASSLPFSPQNYSLILPFARWWSIDLNPCSTRITRNYYLFSSTDCPGGVIIVEPRRTFDCLGNRIRGAGKNNGFILGNNAILRNCRLTNFNIGIIINDSVARVESSFLENNNIGILVDGASGEIFDTIIENSSDIGISVVNGKNSTFARNNLFKNKQGLILQNSFESKIYHNNFINNAFQASDNGLNDWYLKAEHFQYSTSGNYWSDFDELSEGCVDEDKDGICDDYRNISGGINKDEAPFSNQNSFLPRCGSLITRNTVLENDLICDGVTNALTIYEKVSLDCNNHVISNKGRTGILATGNDIKIQNCIIQNSDLGLKLENSELSELRDLQIIGNNQGINLVEVNKSVIKNSLITRNGIGINLTSSSDNSIESNVISDNNDGIVAYGGVVNLISSNIISYNSIGMLGIDVGPCNRILSNYFIDNKIGLSLASSSGNSIINNFFSNSENANSDAKSLNRWNSTKDCKQASIIESYCFGGNFWHDYSGIDETGDYIGDTLLPYNTGILDGSDFLPLVKGDNADLSVMAPENATIGEININVSAKNTGKVAWIRGDYKLAVSESSLGGEISPMFFELAQKDIIKPTDSKIFNLSLNATKPGKLTLGFQMFNSRYGYFGNEVFIVVFVLQVPSDYDGDGIPDYIDNCPNNYNPGQEDHTPLTPEGDACDPDGRVFWMDDTARIPSTIYFTGEQFIGTEWPGKIYKSSNGIVWEETTITNWNTTQTFLEFNGKLYAGGANGTWQAALAIYNPFTNTWSKLKFPNPNINESRGSMINALIKTSSGYVLAGVGGTAKYHGKIYRSTDNMSIWTEVSGADMGAVVKFLNIKGIIFAFTRNWTVNESYPTLAIGKVNIFYSKDEGASWKAINFFEMDDIQSALVDSRGDAYIGGTSFYIYPSGHNGAVLFGSSDDGATWTKVKDFKEYFKIQTLYDHAGTLFLAGMHQSSNMPGDLLEWNASGWQSVIDLQSGENGVGIIFVLNNTLFIGTDANLLHYPSKIIKVKELPPSAPHPALPKQEKKKIIPTPTPPPIEV